MILLSLIVALFWSISTLLTKHILLKKLDQRSVFFYTNVVYILFMIPYFIYNRKVLMEDSKNVTWPIIGWVMFISIVIGSVSGIIYLYLLNDYPSSIVTAITNTYPVIILLISVMYFKESLTFTTCIGIFLAVLGTAIVAYNQHMVNH